MQEGKLLFQKFEIEIKIIGKSQFQEESQKGLAYYLLSGEFSKIKRYFLIRNFGNYLITIF